MDTAAIAVGLAVATGGPVLALPFPTYGGSGINISSWDGTQDINAINSAGPFRRTWQDRREIGVSDHFLHAVTADADTAIAGVAGGRVCAMKFRITFP